MPARSKQIMFFENSCLKKITFRSNQPYHLHIIPNSSVGNQLNLQQLIMHYVLDQLMKWSRSMPWILFGGLAKQQITSINLYFRIYHV